MTTTNDNSDETKLIDSTTPSIYNAVAESTFIKENSDDQVHLTITKNYDYVMQLCGIEMFVQLALSNIDPAFKVKYVKGTYYANKTKIGAHLSTMMWAPSRKMIDGLMPGHSLSPNVNLFIDTAESFGLDLNTPIYTTDQHGRPYYEHINAFVDQLRRNSEGFAYKSDLKRRLDKANKNHQSLKEYFDRLFEYYARLIIVKVDLSYLKEFKHSATIDIARDHFKRLLDNRKNNKIFEHLVGYAWGLEFNVIGETYDQGGYHYHCLFIFDGEQKEPLDTIIGDSVGNYWTDNITDGKGHFNNCNRDKERHAREGILGIGAINRDDTQMRNNLIEKVAPYITKKGLFFEIKSSNCKQDGFDTFGRGEMPPPMEEGNLHPISMKKLRAIRMKEEELQIEASRR